MPEIVLTEEQATVVTSALQPVHVRDGRGNVLGTIAPVWTAEDIADAKRRLAAGEPRYTTAEVLAHLRSLGGHVTRYTVTTNGDQPSP